MKYPWFTYLVAQVALKGLPESWHYKCITSTWGVLKGLQITDALVHDTHSACNYKVLRGTLYA